METIIVQKLRLQNENFMAGYRQMSKDKRDFPVDIVQSDNRMRVIAELPDIDGKNIRVDLNEDILIIFASGKDKSYYKNIELPEPAENIIGELYNSGVLEIILR